MNRVIIPLTRGLYISQYYERQNFAGREVLFAGRFKGKGDIYRSLVFFDIDYINEIISPGNIIKSAYLKFYIVRNDLANGQKIKLRLYPIDKEWTENEVKWNNQPLFDEKEETFKIIEADFTGNVSLVLTKWTREWYEKKRLNYGIMICGEEENDGLIALGGIRFPEVQQRPVLIINFSNFNY